MFCFQREAQRFKSSNGSRVQGFSSVQSVQSVVEIRTASTPVPGGQSGSVEKHGGRDSTKGVFSPCPLSNRMGIWGFPHGDFPVMKSHIAPLLIPSLLRRRELNISVLGCLWLWPKQTVEPANMVCRCRILHLETPNIR